MEQHVEEAGLVCEVIGSATHLCECSTANCHKLIIGKFRNPESDLDLKGPFASYDVGAKILMNDSRSAHPASR